MKILNNLLISIISLSFILLAFNACSQISSDFSNNENEKIAENLAKEQLDAYNKGDIEAFLKPYSDDCEIFEHSTGKSLMKGKEAMRETYSKLFIKYPDLYCQIVSRMVLNNYVIDYENVRFSDSERVKAIAIYEIKDNQIKKVWFIK